LKNINFEKSSASGSGGVIYGIGEKDGNNVNIEDVRINLNPDLSPPLKDLDSDICLKAISTAAIHFSKITGTISSSTFKNVETGVIYLTGGSSVTLSNDPNPNTFTNNIIGFICLHFLPIIN
jgi:predicted outer membrane repeat protein